MPTQSGAAMVYERQGSDDGTDLATSNLRRNNKTETTHSDAGLNDSAANINTNTTALRIIIDFPSYTQTHTHKEKEMD
jgi:hypothetical protein